MTAPRLGSPTDQPLIADRYRLVAELGQGGVGTVYRAHDALLERDVAVKLLGKGGTTLNTEARARLLHEARLAAQLNHPHIVSIYDAGEVDGQPFIIMELVEGQSLQDYPVGSITGLLSIVGQVCEAWNTLTPMASSTAT
jgi:serine/threonine-protein kinase